MKSIDKALDWLSIGLLLAACISAVVKLNGVLSGRYSMLFALMPVTDEFINDVITALKMVIPPVIVAWGVRFWIMALEWLRKKHEEERV